MRTVSSRSFVFGAADHRRASGGNGFDFDGGGERGAHDANLRDARASRKWNWPRADGKFDPGSAPAELQIRFAHGDQHQYFGGSALRTFGISHGEEIRG